MGDARRRVNPFGRFAAPESKKAPPKGEALLAKKAPVYFLSSFFFSSFFIIFFFLWCFIFFGAT